ncbi:MAG: M24 family metallopeptidase [Thermodesulfobacteriota bacterium]
MSPLQQNRIESVRKELKNREIDALLVQFQENRRYLSGFTGEDGGIGESAGALLISRQALILATDSRYVLQAENESPDYRIHCYQKGLAKELPEILTGQNIRRLGFETRRMTCAQYDMVADQLAEQGAQVELVGTKDIVEHLRIIKDDTEVQAIRDAVDLAEKAFAKVMESLKPGMTEIDTAWALEKQMREAGAEGLSFPVIVAAGPNAALPHAVPGKRAIAQGEPVLFDWGARLNGYCSDTSRTVILGKPDATFQKVFTAVYDAQQKAIAAVRPGAFTKDIDAVARDVLKENELDQYFGHGLGHGVGLAVHEQPSVSPVDERNTRLEEGMIFTVEPGVYLPDWGGVRLENMVAVCSDGAEVLNQLNVRL